MTAPVDQRREIVNQQQSMTELLRRRNMDWQPIETAPKDGENVLLWIPSEGDYEIADWRTDANAWDTDNGWLQGEPSHWMRPDPPK